MDDFRNRVCIITDGFSAVGFKTAELLARQGARLVLLKSQTDESSQMVFTDDTMLSNITYRIEHVDLCVSAALEKMIERIENDPAIGPPTDLFFNTVPPFVRQRILDMPKECLEALINRDLTSLFLTVKIIGSAIVRNRKGGSMVMLGSIHDDKPTGIAALQSMYMGALKNLSREAALYFGYGKVRTNLIEVGAMGGEDERYRNDLSSFYEGYSYKVPSGYIGNEEDIAALAVFLMSERARYINGAEIRMDGGLVLHYLDEIANFKAEERRQRLGTHI